MIESLLAYGWWVGALCIVLGFVALVKGADWLVDGASAIAKRFGISDLVIGLTVVAFGTSMPEFVVNMVSVAEGSTDLALTNILGSNIINTFVILGLTALVYPIASQKRSRDFDIPMSIIAGLFVLVFVAVQLPFGEDGKGVGRIGGVILLLLFCYFLYNTFRHAKDHPSELPSDEGQSTKKITLRRAICLILGGLVGLVVGGELIVKSAVDLATRMGVSEAIIGLTIVALGTSLPELATSVIAAAKHNSDIALGNVFGSNIFNVFFVLATSATVRPLPAYEGIELDAVMAALGSIIVWLAVKTNDQRMIQRWAGALLLLVYGGYLTYRLMNV
ncbi:MAG: calcium/sodium antiporter [Paludibacteraceae bacterium]|nr:calcium/sodium antiporter [Paludibacteraceae bacterium]MBR2166696.1 calcium/sodium antiporter [Paludibacteraceae bacterium]